MISKWAWYLRKLSHKLWLRATLISLLAVAAALVSLAISPYLPEDLSTQIGADAVDNILSIIASSMLAVTTFSLSTMVAAYSAATTSVTPRATKLLLEDTTTQNVLATFIGSFLYSLVAIITLTMGLYGERGRVVLFAVTLLVILLIVITMLRWIDYVIRLGRVGETTDQVERTTAYAMRTRRTMPYLGGRRAMPGQEAPSQHSTIVCSPEIGYVQHIDLAALQEAAEALDLRVFIAAMPGVFVDPGRALLWFLGDAQAEDKARLSASFTIAPTRSFEQDPRFGLCVLAEIAQRALSPGINDPGTAIDVIGRGVRLLSIIAEPLDDDEVENNPRFDRIHVPPLTAADMFEDFFAPIARDGSSNVEVQIRLQKAYQALSTAGDGRFSDVSVQHAGLSLRRAEADMPMAHDIQRVRAAAAALVPDNSRSLERQLLETAP